MRRRVVLWSSLLCIGIQAACSGLFPAAVPAKDRIDDKAGDKAIFIVDYF